MFGRHIEASRNGKLDMLNMTPIEGGMLNMTPLRSVARYAQYDRH